MGISAVIDRMEQDLSSLRASADRRRFFHATYLRTTVAVAEQIDRGVFEDNPWLERWDVAFAQLYLDALDADRTGSPIPLPWRVAFDTARDRTDLPPLRHVLLGMNAHINFDLPQALLAVITSEEFDDPVIRGSRSADHRHIDEILAARVGAEGDAMSADATPTRMQRWMAPVNRASTRRFLAEARAKVWHNTLRLDTARRVNRERYATELGRLEVLCTDRLRELTRPGQVLVRLARSGFGVVLSPEGLKSS